MKKNWNEASPTAEVKGLDQSVTQREPFDRQEQIRALMTNNPGLTQEAAAGSEGTGLLVLTPNENIQAIYNKK